MTQDDIIRMAHEAGLDAVLKLMTADELDCMDRFVKMVAAAEREACAQVCEANSHPCREFIDQASICAADIRARGEKGRAS